MYFLRYDKDIHVKNIFVINKNELKLILLSSQLGCKSFYLHSVARLFYLDHKFYSCFVLFLFNQLDTKKNINSWEFEWNIVYYGQ